MQASRSRRWRAFLFLVAMVEALAVRPANAASYTIDPKETTANFEVWFSGLLPLRGNFLRTSGTLFYDRATKQGSVEVFIDTTTLIASNERAQALARGPEFFAVDKYPSIEFRSSRFVFDERRLRFIEGSLTLVGNTQPVVLTVTDSRCDFATEHESANCQAVAEVVVKRSAFGMKAWARTVSEEVTIRIAITARQAADKMPRTEPPAVDPGTEPVEPARGRQDIGDAPK